MTNKISMGGETKSIRKWVEEFDNGIALATVYNRLQLGWGLLEALTRPVNTNMSNSNRKSIVRYYYDGNMLTTREIAIRTGYTVNCIRNWLRLGKPILTKYPVDFVSPLPEVELSTAEIHISNLIASGESYESVAKRIRDREIV